VATELLRRSLFPSARVPVALTRLVGDLEGKPREAIPNLVRLGEARLLRDLPAEELRATVPKARDYGSETSRTPLSLRGESADRGESVRRRSSCGRFLPDSSIIARFCALGDLQFCGPTIETSKMASPRVKMPTPIASLWRTNGTDNEVNAFSRGISRAGRNESQACRSTWRVGSSSFLRWQGRRARRGQRDG
jgi:hypothetical protein